MVNILTGLSFTILGVAVFLQPTVVTKYMDLIPEGKRERIDKIFRNLGIVLCVCGIVILVIESLGLR